MRLCKLLCLLLCLVLLSGLAVDCFRYYDYNVMRLEGFYSEPKNSLDVVFLGASDVFTDFSSGLAYDQFGFTSYPFAQDANPGIIYQSQLREVINRQNPQKIVVEINGFLYDSRVGDRDWNRHLQMVCLTQEYSNSRFGNRYWMLCFHGLHIVRGYYNS